MSETELLIEQINKSTNPYEIFKDLTDWKTPYKNHAKALHPDNCTLPGADDAIRKLSVYKEELEKGTNIIDDAGPLNYKFNELTFSGDKALLELSYRNYMMLMALPAKEDTFFKQYIPQSASMNAEGELKFVLPKRAVPLSAMAKFFNGKVPQVHVNWVVNRLLEFCCWMYDNQLVHCGINPDSVFIVPETHGIFVTSFYHLTPYGQRLKTASGKYLPFYPGYILSKNENLKLATTRIDVELVTRTAVWLLGDKSGIGSSLRKTENNELLSFYSDIHQDASEAVKEHLEILGRHFKKEFYPLNL